MTRITLGSAVLRGTVVPVLMASLTSTTALGAPPVDLSKWSPEYVRSIAGTQEFDTAADCGKVTPLDSQGRLTFWSQGVFEGDPAARGDDAATTSRSQTRTVRSAEPVTTRFPSGENEG